MLTEAEDEHYEEDEEPYDEDYEEQDVAEALKTEVEEFYEELQAHGDGADGMWDQGEAAKLEQACAALSEASEALQTVRDAKEALRRRSPKGAKGSKGTGKTKTKSKSKPTSSTFARVQDRKKRSTCKDCGEIGHWSGDAECNKRYRVRGARP